MRSVSPRFGFGARHTGLLAARQNSAAARCFLGLWLCAAICALTATAAAATDDDLWTARTAATALAATLGEGALPPAYAVFSLNQENLSDALSRAPEEFTEAAEEESLVISLPTPEGGLGRFRVEESPILSPELQAQHPDIRTYTARGIDDPTAQGRLDVTPLGFHAYIVSGKGTIVVNPVSSSDEPLYLSFWKHDLPAAQFECATDESGEEHLEDLFQAFTSPNNPSGNQLRTYRLAVSATGEYTRWAASLVPGCNVGGPTWPACGTAAAAAQIATTMNRVTGIYEQEVAIRLNLTATNIYDDPATDPFTGANVGPMRGENQTDLDANVGSANYDVGHILSEGNLNGVARLGVVCNNTLKAWGATSLDSARGAGDPFDVDYVAHEIGHQFNANHTWNANTGGCTGTQFVASAAYEPGSGSTIMGYAGICPSANPTGGQNVQPNSDPYFHTRNFDEITAFRDNAGSGGSCGTQTATGNTVPVVDAGSDYTIPQDTPFTLTASGTDADGDALTFNWEQFDLGGPRGLPQSTATNGPLFRSRLATASTSRTLPTLADVLAAAPGSPSTTWEMLPTVNRGLNFRVTARDNRAGGGGVDWDAMAVTVAGSRFFVQNPGSGDNLECGDSETIDWTVGGGSVASNVRVLLSQDGGANFANTLLASTANDGSEAVTLPKNLRTTNGRIKLEPTDNIFFAISGPFSIEDTLDPTVTPPADLPAVECTSPSGATPVLGSATATDLCDANLTIFNDAPPGDFPLGATNVTWTAIDDDDNSDDAVQQVTVVDTTPPQITAPPDVTAECASPDGTAVTLGTATASDTCDPNPVVTDDAPALFPLGSTTVIWTATDNQGLSNTATQTVLIEDDTPPELAVSVTPAALWPPNHKLKAIQVEITVSDVCDADPTVTLVSIESDEPDDGLGDGDTKNDIQGADFGSDDREFELRAERSGAGDGRSYTITYRATDASGNTTVAQAVVTVPKSQVE